MNILIMTDSKGGTAHLTTDSPMCKYGIPILRIEADDIDGDFGPADLIGTPPKLFPAADIVMSWLLEPKRTEEEILAGKKFLSQWQEYYIPLLPGELKEIRKEHNINRKVLANICGVSPRTVENWEQGRRSFPKSAMMLLKAWLESQK